MRSTLDLNLFWRAYFSNALLYIKIAMGVLVAVSYSYFFILAFPPFKWILVILSSLFLIFFTLDLIARKKMDVNRFVQDLELTRHILVVWFIAPFFWLYFRFLMLIGSLKIRVNGQMPFGEKRWIAVGNHPDAKLRDTFLMPVILFYLRAENVFDPIKFFPVTVADEHNFVKSKIFEWLLGKKFLIGVKRNGSKKDQGPQDATKNGGEEDLGFASGLLRPREFLNDFLDFGGGRILNIEGGRTVTAINRGEFEAIGVGEDILVQGKPILGAAWLSKHSDAPIVPYRIKVWGDRQEPKLKRFLEQFLQGERIKGDFKNPKASPSLVLFGLLELMFDPRIRISVEIGLPEGPLRPSENENVRDLTARIQKAELEVGKLQLKHIKEDAG